MTKEPRFTAWREYAWRRTVKGVRHTITAFNVYVDGVRIGLYDGYGKHPSTRKADAIRRARLELKSKPTLG